MLPNSRINQLRLLGTILIVLSLLPLASAGASSLVNDPPEASERRASAERVTFVSTQGGSAAIYDHAGKLVAIHTPTNQRIWTHDDYRRYMDIDPLDENRLLFVAGERTGSDDIQRVAVVINWRTGEELRKFPVPQDTHDVDAVGGGRFAVADKLNEAAYIVNASNGDVVWRYDFKSHFNGTDGDKPMSGGWTHLNDIDLHNNGELVLLSPRDFDRVILINRSTKKTIWALGREDAHSILYEQHNPVLLDRSPPTVLVADSENNRIVEYRRQNNSSWEQVWRYEGDLNWPRDADRLPNGNTLIADTHGDRVLEVTPRGETVWEHSISRGPYDVERLQYGDEPAGPSMATKNVPKVVGPVEEQSLIEKFSAPYTTSYDRAYQLVGAWIIPSWAGSVSFLALCFGLLVAAVWIGIELAIRLPIDLEMAESSSGRRHDLLIGGVLMSTGAGTVPLLIGMTANTTILATLSFVLFAFGLRFVAQAATSWERGAVYRVLFVTKLLSLSAGVALCLALLGTALFGFQSGASHIRLLCAMVVFVAIIGLRGSRSRFSTVEWTGFKRTGRSTSTGDSD